MNLRHLFGAVAACTLIAGAAYAQSDASSSQPSDTTSGAAGSMSQPSDTSGSMSGSTQAAPSQGAAPADNSASGASATSATTYGQSASATTTNLTNGPVPDTRANREKFGGPNSAAGRRTAPKGN